MSDTKDQLAASSHTLCAPLCLVLLIVSACSGRADYREDVSTPLVIKPGVVAVDIRARQKTLSSDKVKQMCILSEKPIPLLNSLEAPYGYGLDNRYNQVSAALRSTGTACFAGNTTACRSIQTSARNWAQSFSVTHPDKSNIFNDTLTINMRLLLPLLSALGIAEAVSPMSTVDRKLVDPWLQNMVRNFEHGMRSEGYYKPASHGISSRKAAHNHAMMSSLAAMSYGAWVGDDKAFRAGLTQWDITLKSMRSDGSLPIETRRGARALFYQGRAIAALIQIAERAHVQNIDLYSRAPADEKTLHQTISFFINAVLNPERVLRYAKVNKAPGPSKNYKKQDFGGTSTLSWIAPYMARFPDHKNTRRLREITGKESYLAPRVLAAVKTNGVSAEWIGIDARCFYAAAE